MWRNCIICGLFKKIFFQALIGIAFSIGFVFGPTIGAAFSRIAREQDTVFHVVPALYALVLSIADIIFVYFFMKETLPEAKRV